jgi:hypothetical protein
MAIREHKAYSRRRRLLRKDLGVLVVFRQFWFLYGQLNAGGWASNSQDENSVLGHPPNITLIPTLFCPLIGSGERDHPSSPVMTSQPQDLDNQPFLSIRDNDAQDHPNTAADLQLHNSDDFLENENEDHGSPRQPQKPSRKSQLSDRVKRRVLALQLGGDTSRGTKSIELTEFSHEALPGDSSATLLQPSDSDDEPTEENTAVPQPATWSPLWLKQSVLGVFLLLFFSCTVAFPILLSYSEKPRGLGRAELSATDVWRFAPTAGKFPLGRKTVPKLNSSSLQFSRSSPYSGHGWNYRL